VIAAADREVSDIDFESETIARHGDDDCNDMIRTLTFLCSK
jgi:hypothetical protein